MAKLCLSIAAIFAVASVVAEGWPSDSCIYSGSTNRTCQATSEHSLSGPFDSLWLSIASAANVGKFYRGPRPGAVIVIR